MNAVIQMSMKMRRANITSLGAEASARAARIPGLTSLSPGGSVRGRSNPASWPRMKAQPMITRAPSAIGRRCTPTETPNTL